MEYKPNHGMRVRNFGLLMAGPLPLEHLPSPSIMKSRPPRRERQRMFAAGPATNIFAAIILMILLGQVAGQFEAADPGVHSSQIVVDSAVPERAGLEAWDVIIAINGTEISDADDFSTVMDTLEANQTVNMEIIRYSSGSSEILIVNLTDKYQYYLDLGWDEETLNAMEIKQEMPFWVYKT